MAEVKSLKGLLKAEGLKCVQRGKRTIGEAGDYFYNLCFSTGEDIILITAGKIADKLELEKYTLGSLRKAVFDGDTMNGSLMAGQVASQIDKIQPIEKIFEQIYEEYEAVRKELYAD